MGKIVVRYEGDNGELLVHEIPLEAVWQPVARPDPLPHRLVDLGPLGRLTEGETAVLRLMGAGLAYEQIAAALYVAERTVRTHAANILSKLGVKNRTQAGLWAVAAGVLTLSEVIDIWAQHAPHLVRES